MISIYSHVNNSDYPELMTDIKRVDGKIEVANKVRFIKAVRDLTLCPLIDAKDFTDDFLRRINKLQPNTVHMKERIKSRLDFINNPDVLNGVLDYLNEQEFGFQTPKRNESQ